MAPFILAPDVVFMLANVSPHNLAELNAVPGIHNQNPPALFWPCFATPDFTRVLTSFNNRYYDCLGYLGLYVNYVSCPYTDKHFEQRDINSILYCSFVGRKVTSKYVIYLQSHPLSTASEMKLFGGLNYFLGAKLLIQWKTSQTF